MDTNRSHEILDGPGVAKLIDAFKYAYDPSVNVQVNFTICAGYTAPPSDPRATYIGMNVQDIRITALQHEDGSGSSLNIWGYCRAGESWRKELTPCKFKAYYDTRTRQGTIQFRPYPAANPERA